MIAEEGYANKDIHQDGMELRHKMLWLRLSTFPQALSALIYSPFYFLPPPAGPTPQPPNPPEGSQIFRPKAHSPTSPE